MIFDNVDLPSIMLLQSHPPHLLCVERATRHRSRLRSWTNGMSIALEEDRSSFVFVREQCRIDTSWCSMMLPGHCSALLNGGWIENGSGIVIDQPGYVGMPMICGPIEHKGRLRYIDGCTDSLLIPPVKLGDPCFNHLHFPPRIKQTMHTHPSDRFGMVVRGRGQCVTPHGIVPLEPGLCFIIKEDGEHCFHTFDEESMDVVAFHPDSDWGPEDKDHPMLNRTIVDGTSAKWLGSIQTKP